MTNNKVEATSFRGNDLVIYISGCISATLMKAGDETGPAREMSREEKKKMFYDAEMELSEVPWIGRVVNPLNVAACEDPALCQAAGDSVSGHVGQDGPGASHTWGCYMRYDIRALTECTHIYMLDGWMNSPGAKLEHDLAQVMCMEIIYQEEGEL